MNGRMWRRSKIGRWLMLAGGVLALLSMGAVFAGWASNRQDQCMREDLLYQTRMLAQTLNLTQIQRLRGNASDVDQPAYRRLKEQLIAARQINPNWKWIYLMGRTPNGAVFFQVDSEETDAPNASSPGQLYEEATDALQDVFNTGHAADEGPVSDRWGAWVSAFMPLKDPETGELISVVGIDVEADLWSRLRARAMRVPWISSLALVAIWLAGAYMLARRARRGVCRTWFCPHIESFLAAATGLTMTLMAVWLVCQVETRNQMIAFRHLASLEVAPLIDSAKGLGRLELEGFAAFFENSEEVTAKEFRRFAAHMSSVSEVLDWSWAEAVEAADRARFEEHTVFRTGKLDYRIWENDAQGQPTIAGARKLYYPIVYMSPKKGKSFALGFDLGSDPLRLAAVESADQTRLTAASDPISFLQAPEGKQGLFVLRPLFHTNDPGRLRGFVAANVKIKSWLITSQRGSPGRQPMAVLDLFQLRTGEPPLWLGSTAEQEELHREHLYTLQTVSTVRPLLVFGKTYAIVAHPTPDFMAMYPTGLSWLVVLAGLILTAAVAWVLGFFAHRRETLARLLDEQHHELATSMRRYDLLAMQNRVVTWEINSEGLYVALSDMAEVISGYPLDELVGRKHYYDLHPEKGRDDLIAVFSAIAEKGEPFADLIHAVVTQSGETVWVSSSGMPLLDTQGDICGYWGTDTDITERKHAEDHLRFQAQLLDCVSESIVSTDLEGRIQYWNHEAEVLFGYTAEEVMGQPYRKFAGATPPPGGGILPAGDSRQGILARRAYPAQEGRFDLLDRHIRGVDPESARPSHRIHRGRPGHHRTQALRRGPGPPGQTEQGSGRTLCRAHQRLEHRGVGISRRHRLPVGQPGVLLHAGARVVRLRSGRSTAQHRTSLAGPDPPRRHGTRPAGFRRIPEASRTDL